MKISEETYGAFVEAKKSGAIRSRTDGNCEIIIVSTEPPPEPAEPQFLRWGADLLKWGNDKFIWGW